VPARRLWHVLVECARDSAEPGALFIDTINAANNLAGLETIAATNPCGEQPLPAFGSCVLGPINLSRLVRFPFGRGGTPYFDFARLADMTRTQVRLLDNVLDLTRWPLAAYAHEAAQKRRIGVSVTGLADALTMLRVAYHSATARETAARIARCMRDHAYSASAELADERGAFPCFDVTRYLEPGRFAAGLPEPVRDAIARQGLRNSHLLSFAPAGGVSVAFFDNCSNGIEPAYRWTYPRAVRIGDAPPHWATVENHAYRLWRELNGAAPLPDYFVHAAQVTSDAQVAMLAALQPYVDAAISKTVIVAPDASHRQVDALLFAAWRAGLKGITVFRPDPALDAVLDASSNQHDVPEDTAGCSYYAGC
jgi:ribonucleoside-diphosphate reductase alpha chain